MDMGSWSMACFGSGIANLGFEGPGSIPVHAFKWELAQEWVYEEQFLHFLLGLNKSAEQWQFQVKPVRPSNKL